MATDRVGYYLRSSNYRLGIYTHMMFFNVRIPIHQVYLQMARLLQINEPDESLWHFNVANESLNIENLEHYNLAEQKYIVINSNASDLRIERRWPWKNFVNLISALSEKFPEYKIFL